MDDLYLMPDGTYVKPSEVTADKAGVLRSKTGMAVVLEADGNPVTAASNAASSMNAQAAKVGVSDAPPPEIVQPAAAKKEPAAPVAATPAAPKTP